MVQSARLLIVGANAAPGLTRMKAVRSALLAAAVLSGRVNALAIFMACRAAKGTGSIFDALRMGGTLTRDLGRTNPRHA